MTRKFTPASQSLKQAYDALERGDKHAARYWAQVTAAKVPGMEDPWLILAAVASPKASLAYLERALAINPNSQRARDGLKWAYERHVSEMTSSLYQPMKPAPVQPAEVQLDPDVVQALQASPEVVAEVQLDPDIVLALQSSPEAVASLPVEVPAQIPLEIPSQVSTKTKASGRPQQSHDKRLWGLLLISPWLVGLVLFKLAPLLATFGISFTDFYLLTPDKMSFVGLKNYIDLFRDPNLGSAFLGTIKLALIVIPLQTAGAILLASLLSSEKLRMKDTLRVLFFLPSIIPSAAALFMWQGFTNPRSGWLYALFLNPLGLAKFVHFSSRGSTPSLLILSTLWAIGPGFMIITGAMQGIPTEMFEAALVDGANRLRRFFSITLPMVSPAIFFTLILNLTAVFGGAILLDRGYSFNSNLSSVDNYLYFILFNTFRLGSAAGLAWIFFTFLLVLVLVLFVTSKRWVYFPDPEN